MGALILATPGAALAGGTTTPDTTINTGDALADTSITTTANTTAIDTNATGTAAAFVSSDGAATPSDQATTSASSSSVVLQSAPSEEGDDTASSTNHSDATTTTHATTSADTGSNLASSDGSVSVTTGNAISTADVLNVLNTTIVDSTGLIQFLSNVLGINDFDVRSQFLDVFTDTATAESTVPCSLALCSGISGLSTTTNAAAIVNNVVVRAATGANGASGDTAQIATSNAYANANVINVANTNIVDSQYLLLVFNDFSGQAGNLILPNSDFFTHLFGGGGVSTVSASNTAAVTNAVDVVADSGGNETVGTTTSIQTGNTTVAGTVLNTVNQNFIGGNSFSMVIRVFGEWSGSVYGLPEGMSWENTPAGIRIFSTPPEGGVSGAATLATHNTATVENNVQVYALTGDNYAAGVQASVRTGDAYANASIINLLNTNIVGSNWASLIFNIYGNWNGSLSFGQSDLWLGVRATSPDTPIMPGSPVTYTYTVFNHGDLTAHNLRLVTENEHGVLSWSNDDETATQQGTLDAVSLDIGTLAPGATKEFTRVGTISDLLPRRTLSSVPLRATITGDEPDANEEDNTDTVTVTVGSGRSGSGVPGGTMAAHVAVTKTANATEADPGDTVTYTVGISNTAGTLYDAVLVDILEAADGTIVNEQFVPLDDLTTDATLEVSYDIALSDTVATGTYTNTAQVIGFDRSSNLRYQQSYSSPVATHVLTVGSSTSPVAQVLGASDSCTPYLTEYLRHGQTNDAAEVAKLQTFLNTELVSNLAPTGIFDTATEAAVRAFQSKYASDILGPWRVAAPTGYVYYTTKKKVNELHCQGMVSFPLTPAQRLDIARATQHQTENQRLAIAAPPPATKPRAAEAEAAPEAAPDASNQVVPRTEATTTQPRTPAAGSIRSLLNHWFVRATNIFSLR